MEYYRSGAAWYARPARWSQGLSRPRHQRFLMQSKRIEDALLCVRSVEVSRQRDLDRVRVALNENRSELVKLELLIIDAVQKDEQYDRWAMRFIDHVQQRANPFQVVTVNIIITKDCFEERIWRHVLAYPLKRGVDLGRQFQESNHFGQDRRPVVIRPIITAMADVGTGRHSHAYRPPSSSTQAVSHSRETGCGAPKQTPRTVGSRVGPSWTTLYFWSPQKCRHDDGRGSDHDCVRPVRG
ncbi:hypothetical protein PBRA_004699 [Plasmodiophora brassicae]|uniref:Uncharacterized protein n=1 Tax=Plasmodiophora brassicae TaxID=37360 RepID=A0A0G4ILG4_PLABS|nr:hypothetical protein PBRA_004699 [Plasmodiophora brassicae]